MNSQIRDERQGVGRVCSKLTELALRLNIWAKTLE